MDESNDSFLNYDYSHTPLNITTGSNAGKWLSILSLLKNGSHSEQVMALTELSNLLSYSNEEYLLGFPSLAYIRILFHILEHPNIKYSKLTPKVTEKSSESQNLGMKMQLPYLQLLSSVYKDDKFLMDNLSTDNLFGSAEKNTMEDSKSPEYSSAMDLDEEDEIEPDSQVFTNKMILSASCLNTILDIIPYTSRYFALNGNLATLCSKLNDLEYIDLAERILLIFEKLSHEIPLSLLKKSVMYHMIQYIDFFPIEIQISTLSCVLNLVRLVDRSEYFSEFVLPIVDSLCSFLQNDNKKMADVVISIWKELLSIIGKLEDHQLVADFVPKLSDNNFLEKVLRLILSPNLGRTAILEYMAILSSLLKLSTDMVEQFFKFDQLMNIKLLCYNQKESLQHIFIHLANSILSNQMENKYESAGEREYEISPDEYSGLEEDELAMSDECELNDDNTEVYEDDSDREQFFCQNVDYFATIFELLPIKELCDTCYLLTSDRHKSAVIGLIYNLLRISNKIEKFKLTLQNTLSVSKTTEFVSTCFLQVDLKLNDTFDSLLGILGELINIFGNHVIVTFHRYGINHYLKESETEELSHQYNKHSELISQILNLNPDPSLSPLTSTDSYREDSDLLFEIRTNIEVWTPYELVKNVPLNRINFVRDEESLNNFITTLVSQSYTTTHIEILWRAFLKILQHTNLYSLAHKTRTHKLPSRHIPDDTTSIRDSGTENYNLTPSSDLETLLLGSAHKKFQMDTGSSNEGNVQLLGNVERKVKMGFEGMLRKYVSSYSTHPFNIIHTELKLRLIPLNFPNMSSFSASSLSLESDLSSKEAGDQNRDLSSTEKPAVNLENDGRLLPICVYVPCLVRVSKLETYLKRYVEKKKNVKVSQLFLYLNDVCLGSSSQLYESLCRFGGFTPKKRKTIANQSHILRYTYTLSSITDAPANAAGKSADSLSPANSRFTLNGGFNLFNETADIYNTPTANIANFNATNLYSTGSNHPNTPESNANISNVETPFLTTEISQNLPQITHHQTETQVYPQNVFNSDTETSRVDTPEEEYGLNIYSLYKGGKYNFRSLLNDFNRFNRPSASYRYDDHDGGSAKMKQHSIKDDSTVDNSSRLFEDYPTTANMDSFNANDSEGKLDMGYLDTNTLMDKFNANNDMEDFYMDATNNYLNNLSDQANSSLLGYDPQPTYSKDDYMFVETESVLNSEAQSLHKFDPATDLENATTSGYENIELNNPILYSKMPNFIGEAEESSDTLNHMMKVVKYDQERISFILGEKNKFEDLLLEAAFPSFPSVISEDKRILLRVMSILANLTENMVASDFVESPAERDQSSEDGASDSQFFPSGLTSSSSLSLKVLSACSKLSTSLCFGCEYWVAFVLTCPQIFSLTARTMLFKMNTLGLNRNLCEFYTRVRNVTNDVISDAFDEYLFEYVSNSTMTLLDEEVKLTKHKLQLDRNNILEDGMKKFQLLQNNPKLEIEYKNEVGIGSGPTLEFFTLTAEAFSGHQSPKLLDYCKGYYYPSPHAVELSDPEALLHELVNPRHDSVYTDGCARVSPEDHLALKLLKLYSFLGKVCAYALLDDKIFGLFFHPLFWRLVKYPNKPLSLTLDTLRLIDAELADSLEKVRTSPDPEKLHLTHEFEGYELFKGGSNVYVNKDNVEEYVQSIIKFKLLSGVKLQIWAFRYGFSTVLPLYSLWFFNDAELSEEIFGSIKNQEEFWTMDHLKTYIIPDHGYDSNSTTFNNLITILHNLDDYNKRLFLKFTTGAPILPKEGFKSLVPLMRVVKKGNVDELPSVMTCTNYLKMPKYKSLEEMKNKLLKAIHEGQNAFNLS